MSTDNWTTPADFPAGTLARATLNEQVPQNILALYNAIVGDAQATGEIIQRIKSGTLANLPAAGNAGRQYYATDLGVTFLDTGSSMDPIAYNPRICEFMHDPFILDPGAGNGATADGSWDKTVSGSGDVILTNVDSASDVQVRTGTTSGSVAALHSVATFWKPDSTRVPAIFEFIAGLSAVNTMTYRLGLTTGSDPDGDANSIYFEKSDGAGQDNAWTTNTKSGGVKTSNTTALTGTTKRRFTIQVNSATSIAFYVDGVLQFTHTTNITASNLRVLMRVSNSAAVTRVLSVDDFWMYAKRA